MLTTTLRHIVVVPMNISDENCTFFQRYSREIATSYQWIFDALSTVPHDVLEPFLDSVSYAKSKVAGSSLDVYIIKSDLLQESHIDFDREFNILWSTENTFSQTKASEDLFKYKPLHITSYETTEAEFIGNLSPESLNKKVNGFISRVLSELDKSQAVDYILSIVSSEQKKNHTKFKFNPLNHNCTRPLYKTLTGYGFYAEEYEDIKPSDNIEQHVKGMTNLSELIDEIRSELQIPSYLIKNDAIIYCTSMCSFLYKQNSRLWNDIYRKLDKPKRDFLKNGIIRNKLFSNFIVSNIEVFNPYEEPIISGLLKERQTELNLFASVATILGVNQFAPTLRLPNAVMLHHDLLKNISSLICNPNRKSHRNLNVKLKNYSETLKKEIGLELLDASLKTKNKLLTMCDFPIEWISIDGFPIMFTHEISRIPTTPGNLCTQLALTGQRVILPYDTFKDILIISSFKSSDPIKDHLKLSLEYFKSHCLYDNLNIVEVNVDSEFELINELNKFQGSIVIFDCHGNHGGDMEHGWLCIGDEKVDVWSLANRCNIPPIIILSACSTHPIDGSHASVANGLFRCGALSVIGTYAPIRANHAGQFVARLLYRIAAFIPLIVKNRTITWREVISGFLKMSYSTDVLIYMAKDMKILTKEQYTNIHNQTNIIINSNAPEWTNKFVNLISDEIGKSESEVKELIAEKFQFVDTMLYSQLGRPENIMICE